MSVSAEVLYAALDTARELWTQAHTEIPRVSLRALAHTYTHTHTDTRAEAPRRAGDESLAEIFVREYVHRSQPVIFTDALDAWPAFSGPNKWTLSSLSSRHGHVCVCVSVCPNGQADAITKLRVGGAAGHDVPGESKGVVPLAASTTSIASDSAGMAEVFLQPVYTHMPLREAIAAVESGRQCCGGVPYVSFQNDSLRTQTPELVAELGPGFSKLAPARWSLDAMNLWIGDQRSVTSTHKDNYENLYAVLEGEKVFHLAPPCDILWLYEKEYPSGRYVHSAGSDASSSDTPGDWSVELDEGEEGGVRNTPWVSVDLAEPDLARFPLASKLTKYQVRLRAGEMLYLPALWYHRVTQTCPTIAVNAWWDMDYLGPAYAFHRMCQDLAQHLDKR